MLATVPSATLLGTRGHAVTVEVHVGNGIPGFTVVGLPDEACRESRDRVRAALVSSGLPWPRQRITVNLAPSGVRKGGSVLDLPIAVGVLVAADHLRPASLHGLGFAGELGLDGTLRAVPGMVPLAAAMASEQVVVPEAAAHEAALVRPGAVRSVRSLTELAAVLDGEAPWPELPPAPAVLPPFDPLDLADVRGQPSARLALEVAAAGYHHLLLTGPPGAGKSMLAARLPGLLPSLTPELALEVTMVHSAAGQRLHAGLIDRPPLRAPHHTASLVSMVGGGSAAVRPGEASLSHGGVLFLDELAEFAPTVLDGLRQPLEEGCIRITRSRQAVELPARFLLVGATNPCPCGLALQPGACRCPDGIRSRYLQRISGPLLDRFDLRVAVSRPAVDDLLGGAEGESTAVVSARVARARELARSRGGVVNGLLPAHRLDDLAPLTPPARRLLHGALERGELSGRGLHRIRRVALTLCDLLEPTDRVDEAMVAMAMQLRADLLAAVARAA